MKLDGIHHITCITADGPANADFYVRVLGLRLVKKTGNFDAPDAYHLYYGSERGEPGSLLTFFEYPNAGRGRAGAGQIHRLVWRVADATALDFWGARLDDAGADVERLPESLVLSDPEGLGFELVVDGGADPPLVAGADDVPERCRVRGFGGVRAYARDPSAGEELLAKTLGFAVEGASTYSLRGDTRTASYSYDPAPAEPAVEGGGSVHHIAWACEPGDHLAWRQRARAAGMEVTPVLDRKYFRSIYFREPSGVLFEIATKGPGFDVDEPMETLGRDLMLPDSYEALRPRLEKTLRPIPDPRSTRTG